jgi:type VI secretion system protein ImpA
MKRTVDLDELLAPIPGENPSGEDLRYTQLYDDIKEARRSEESLEMGDWQRETKSSDWGRVASLSLEALGKRAKDLQIAAWLTEALTVSEGFAGLESGMRVITGLLELYWETVYPMIEEDDFDYRAAPFEFLNEKVSACIRQAPLTEPRKSPGYSLLKWQESREVGYESDTTKSRRDEMIAEGKIKAEDFDSAVANSSPSFYQSLLETLSRCREAFATLDAVVDGKFGSHAPRISDIGQALEECDRVVSRICRDQKGVKEDAPLPPAADADTDADASGVEDYAAADAGTPAAFGDQAVSGAARQPSPARVSIPSSATVGDGEEESLWNEAMRTMRDVGFKEALNMLLAVATSQPSERGRHRCQLLVARLCLKAGRPDLARPIAEQLHTMVAELQLERWESPFWIAEVLESLHQCLTSGEPSDEDMGRSQELFRKICTMDVTKALAYRK